MATYLEVHTTVDSKEAALRIGTEVVSKRLAACAQVSGPITSTYWWKGSIEQAEEWVCTLKTHADVYPELQAAIKELHPYEVPEIIGVEVTKGNPQYLDWIRDETSSSSQADNSRV